MPGHELLSGTSPERHLEPPAPPSDERRGGTAPAHARVKENQRPPLDRSIESLLRARERVRMPHRTRVLAPSQG